MIIDPTTNFAKCPVSIGYDAAVTSIVLATGKGALLPDPSVSGAFNLVWFNNTDYGDASDDPNKEIVRCTARTADTLTIIRAQEGTTATVKNLAAKVYVMHLSITSKTITALDTCINQTLSSGVVAAANINNIVIMSATAGAIDVNTFDVYLRTSALISAPLVKLTSTLVTALAIPNNTSYYVIATYTAGTVVISISLTDISNGWNIICLAYVENMANVIHMIIPITDLRVDAANFTNSRWWEINGIKRASGAILSAPAVLKVGVSAGIFWAKLIRITTSTFNSNAGGLFSMHYITAGVWTMVTGLSTLPVTQYNDITLGLVALTNNSYYSFYDVYLGVTDGDVRILYGQSQATTDSGVINAPRSASLPNEVNAIAYQYIGRYTFKKNDSAVTSILSSFSGNLNLSTAPTTANQIANTPAGGIIAMDVQAAINELDVEKQGVLTNSAGLAAALNDETGTGAAVFATSPSLTTPTITGGTITGVTDTITTEGVFRKQGLDASPMYHFTGTTLTSGELYTLLGELCMNGWSHNTKINASGNFVDSTGTLKRDEAATCQLWVFTESGMIKCYNAPSASTSTSPVWTLTYSQNISTGAITLASALPIASGGTSLATAATGGLLHAPSTNALSLLAIGAANLKLFVNATGTLPEYAVGMKMGYFTRDTSLASGTQAVTGIFFKPSLVLFFAMNNATKQFSIGMDDLITPLCLYQDTSQLWQISSAVAILLTAAGGSYSAPISSLDAGGFTVNWTKNATMSGTAFIVYLALR